MLGNVHKLRLHPSGRGMRWDGGRRKEVGVDGEERRVKDDCGMTLRERSKNLSCLMKEFYDRSQDRDGFC